MNDESTAPYIAADAERLRKRIQQIVDSMLKAMKIRKSADILDFTLAG
jgi:hypothetical protein